MSVAMSVLTVMAQKPGLSHAQNFLDLDIDDKDGGVSDRGGPDVVPGVAQRGGQIVADDTLHGVTGLQKHIAERHA
jgi:hypothetical protein